MEVENLKGDEAIKFLFLSWFLIYVKSGWRLKGGRHLSSMTSLILYFSAINNPLDAHHIHWFVNAFPKETGRVLYDLIGWRVPFSDDPTFEKSSRTVVCYKWNSHEARRLIWRRSRLIVPIEQTVINQINPMLQFGRVVLKNLIGMRIVHWFVRR